MSHKDAQKAHKNLYFIAPFVPFCGHLLLDNLQRIRGFPANEPHLASKLMSNFPSRSSRVISAV